jgi:hypothetical protein
VVFFNNKINVPHFLTTQKFFSVSSFFWHGEIRLLRYCLLAKCLIMTFKLYLTLNILGFYHALVGTMIQKLPYTDCFRGTYLHTGCLSKISIIMWDDLSFPISHCYVDGYAITFSDSTSLKALARKRIRKNGNKTRKTALFDNLARFIHWVTV